jgi:hypothetical protein
MVYLGFLLTTLILIWRRKVRRRVAESAIWRVGARFGRPLHAAAKEKWHSLNGCAITWSRRPRGGALGID